MKYVIRLKCVSECMRIRRAALCYLENKPATIDLSTLPHPLKKFKGITYENGNLIYEGNSQRLALGEEIYFYKKEAVDTGGAFETQTSVLGAMLIPLDKEMEPYYLEQIKDGYTFDQWNGEFEYLLGLMYELDLGDDAKANEWYQRAKDKRFLFELKREVM